MASRLNAAQGTWCIAGPIDKRPWKDNMPSNRVRFVRHLWLRLISSNAATFVLQCDARQTEMPWKLLTRGKEIHSVLSFHPFFVEYLISLSIFSFKNLHSY